MLIGVIASTQKELPREALDALRGVDWIVHCGRVGDPAVIDRLSCLAPVTGVRAEVDSAEAVPFPAVLFKKWAGAGVLVLPELGDPNDPFPAARREIEKSAPRVVIYGGEPKAGHVLIDGRLYVSPGCAVEADGSIGTVALIGLEGTVARAEIVPLAGDPDSDN